MKEVENGEVLGNNGEYQFDKLDSVINYRSLQKNKKKKFTLSEDDKMGIQLLREEAKKLQKGINDIQTNAEYNDEEKRKRIKDDEDLSKHMLAYANALLKLDGNNKTKTSDEDVAMALHDVKEFNEYVREKSESEGKNNDTRIISLLGSFNILYYQDLRRNVGNLRDAFSQDIISPEERQNYEKKRADNNIVDETELDNPNILEPIKKVENKEKKVIKVKTNNPSEDLEFDVKDTASAKISELQKMFSNPSDFENMTSYPSMYFGRILSARIISGAKNGDPQALQTRMKMGDINSTYEMLEDNPHFKGFCRYVKENGKLLEKAEKAASSKNGDELATMFTNYIAHQPLKNLYAYTEDIDIFMPNVKKRIEVLQSRAEKKLDDKSIPVAEIAEIIVLRRHIKAERGNKSSLNKPYVDDARQLRDEVDELMNNEEFQKYVSKRDVYKKVSTGHGGEMIDEFRKQFKKDSPSPYIRSFLQAGTINYELDKLREELSSINSRLNEMNNKGASVQEKSELNQQAISTMAEYISMAALQIKKKLKPDANVPWSQVERGKQDAMKNQDFLALFGDENHLDKSAGVLSMLRSFTDAENVENINFKMNKVKTQRKQAALEAKNAKKAAENNPPVM